MMCQECALVLGIWKEWDKAPMRTFRDESCELCGKESGLHELKSRLSPADLRMALPAVKRNSDEALKKREQEAKKQADKELERSALELARNLAKQYTPAQLKVKAEDAKRVVPTRKRVITLD